MASITYENKVALNVDPTIPDKNKCTAGDMNEIKSVVNGKQDELVSGTSIKTINDISILGSGNITISETTPTITYSQTANTDVGNATTRRLDLDTLNVGTYIYYNYTATSAFYFKYTKPNASTKTNLMIPNSTGSDYSIGSTGANYRTVEVEMYKKTSEIASMSAAANEAVCKITLKAVKPGYSSRRSNAADSQTISYFIYKNNDDGTLAVGYAGEITNTYLIDAKMEDKQDKLVRGTNRKTINNKSLLGSGNISLEATPEISIGTTTPSGDEVLWINPEDTPSGSLNPITNEYSEATDKGYSCDYLNGRFANMGKTLWTGSFTSGSIDVPDLSKYWLIGVVAGSVFCIGNKAFGGGIYGTYGGTSYGVVSYRLSSSGDTFSINSNDKGAFDNGTQVAITQIIGIF